MSEDPFEYVTGPNQYEYVISQSIGLLDPTGLEPIDPPPWPWGLPHGEPPPKRAAPVRPKRTVIDLLPGFASPSGCLTGKSLAEVVANIPPNSIDTLIFSNHGACGSVEVDKNKTSVAALDFVLACSKDKSKVNQNVLDSTDAIIKALQTVKPGGTFIIFACKTGEGPQGDKLLDELHKIRPDITIKAPRDTVNFSYGEMTCWYIFEPKWNTRPSKPKPSEPPRAPPPALIPHRSPPPPMKGTILST
jgi:hypothetical protein